MDKMEDHMLMRRKAFVAISILVLAFYSARAFA